MLYKIIHTVGGRAILGICNLAVLLITTRWLGAEIKGEISLLVLDISFVVILSGFIGGPSLVYLGSRVGRGEILLFSYLWAIVSSLAVGLACYFTGTIPDNAFWLLFIAGFAESVLSAHLMLLLAGEKIARHNVVQVFKPLLNLLLLVLFIKAFGFLDFRAFGYAFVISTFASLLLVFDYSFPFKKISMGRGELKKLFGLGFYNQAGNLAQLFNYRLSLYVIEFFVLGQAVAHAMIGVYSTSLQIVEILWLISRSISMVQYARISNMKDDAPAALQITYDLIKLSFFATLCCAMALVIVPEGFYVTVLGEGFAEVRDLIVLLLPGVLFFTVSGGLSHLCSGLGLHRLNMLTSVFGLALSIPAYLFLFKPLGLPGLAIAASGIYVVQTLFQLLLVKQRLRFNIALLAPSKKDFSRLLARIKT